MTTAAGHYPQPIEGHIGRSVGMAGQHQLFQLDLLFTGGKRHKTSSLTLIDSVASHTFLNEWITLATGLCMDCLRILNVKLADGEKGASLGMAHGVQVTFALGIVLQWGFCIILLLMDVILSALQLRGV